MFLAWWNSLAVTFLLYPVISSFCVPTPELFTIRVAVFHAYRLLRYCCSSLGQLEKKCAQDDKDCLEEGLESECESIGMVHDALLYIDCEVRIAHSMDRYHTGGSKGDN